MDNIVLTNAKIIKYFKEHKELDPESTFLFFIEILKKFGDNIIESMSMSVNKQILDTLTEQSKHINIIHETISKLNQDITNSLFVKMHEIKKDYIEDVKNVIQSNTTEKISNIIEKNNSQLIDKTTLLLNDFNTKTNHSISSGLTERINEFQRTLKDETDKIKKLVDTDDNHLKEYFNLFEIKFSQLVQGIQQPIHMYINSSEEKINNNITTIRDLTKENTQMQTKLYSEMNDFLTKYKMSNYKGSLNENQLSLTLNQMFPSGEIVQTTGQKASGDFILKRLYKPNIMLENKDYTENVYIEEIRKFIRDADNLKMHSIFLSQKSGIASKSNYQIEYHNGIILVYVHKVEYSKEKIQIAIDIIDNLHARIQEFSTKDEDNTISYELLEDINRDFQNFAIQKDTLIGIIKDTNKKALLQIDELKFPSLEKYLSTQFASIANITKFTNQYKCELCNLYLCNTKKSLSAHQRGCKNNTKQSVQS